MLFKSEHITQASGSVGGVTYSHNAGGMYRRARTIPTDPQTVPQMEIRGLVAGLTSAWVADLTQVQRDAWETYNANVTIPNALGDPRHIGALAHYVRSNVPRMQSGFARVDDAPTEFDLGTFSNPTFDTFVGATELFNVNFTSADAWANETNGAMLCFSSRTQNPSINFFKGPYQVLSAIPGASGSPPVQPASKLAAFPIEVGNRTFVSVRFMRADGRLSLPFRGFGLGA